MNELLTPAVWAGAGTGTAATLVIMSLVFFLRRRAMQMRNARRDRIITSVQEKSTDVDCLIVSYRSGKINIETFRNSLSEKIEIINRTYKPGLHLLDIFFIKYTEKLIEEYYRMIETGVVDLSQRDTVAFSILPIHKVAKKEGKEASEVATLVSKVEKEQVPKETGPEPEAAPELSGDAVISAMAEASKVEKELPLETYLEMDTGAAGVIGETARTISAPEEKKEEEEPLIPPEEKVEKITKAEETIKEDKKPMPEPPQAEAEFPEETMAVEHEFAFADKVSPAVSPVAEETVIPPETEKERREDEETMAEAAVSFQVKIPPSSHVEPPKPVTPLRPPATPEPSHEETIQQPATIYDIEAETIIADRSELLGVNKATPETPPDKSQIGITGDDVSDMLDQFFGGKK